MTVCAWLIVTVQLPVPEQAPLQPVKLEEFAGVAVRVTVDSAAKLWAQSVPQLIPAGEEVTVPEPVPEVATESR